MKRPFRIIFSICMGVGVVVFIVSFGVTASLVDVADDFFAALEDGDFQGAYGHLSSEFHGDTSIAELRSFAQESALAGYSDATWWERTIEGDEGCIDGEVQIETGQRIPVSIFFLKEGDVWKIRQIDWESDDPPEEEWYEDAPSDRPPDTGAPAVEPPAVPM